jgi:hypothetical protein
MQQALRTLAANHGPRQQRPVLGAAPSCRLLQHVLPQNQLTAARAADKAVALVFRFVLRATHQVRSTERRDSDTGGVITMSIKPALAFRSGVRQWTLRATKDEGVTRSCVEVYLP